ncbi:hypothetical protein 6939_0026 [Klebsiella phage 6939]|uniref:Uncharacterized protein n=1 Tax=Klebsiella phage 6939 TaxID=2912295 RepID=A0A9E7M6L4_9CAUD|nr:hypothetical protein 6939_0026 [Klebsiella phage 6939]
MIKYIHTFKVSSGKGRKEITKVYDNYGKAWREYSLLGGKLEELQVNRTWGGLK